MDLSFIKLEMDEQSRLLAAEVSDVPEDTVISDKDITDFIHAHGYLHFLILTAELATLVKRTNENKTGRYIIAEKRNAELSLFISDDKMEAFAEVTPPHGGTGITHDTIDKELALRNIKIESLVTGAINQLLVVENNTRILIARGKLAERGRNGKFEWLLDDGSDEDEDNDDITKTIDYRAGKFYSVVIENTPILKYQPAERSTPGFNVMGDVLSAEDGKDISFGKDWKGIEKDPQNPNIYLASFRGHPVNLSPGARIDKTLQFRGVNLSTGHIDFDGSIEINGDVEPAMKIKVTGDVHVKGTVERAEIIAGNDITVTGGILGEETKIAEYIHNDEDDTEQKEVIIDYQCSLKAGGEIEAKFVNFSEIEATNIHIREYAFHSSLMSKNSIYMGQNGGKGIIVGGIAKADSAVRANALGNETYTPTKIIAGITFEEREALRSLKNRRKEYRAQALELVETLNSIKKESEHNHLDKETLIKAKEAKSTLNGLRKEIGDLADTIQHISSVIEAGNHEIESKKVFINVDITVDGVNQLVLEEHKSVTWIAIDNKITVK